jgi:transposase
MSANGMVRPCSCPASKLARGAKDEEHVMSQTPRTAVIGIDIGKNAFYIVGHGS